MSNSVYVFTTITKNWFLQLKPLESISDEGAGYVMYGRNREEFLQYFFGYIEYFRVQLSPSDYDYLRSKSYALSWMDLSVQDLIDYGWVKLKQKQHGKEIGEYNQRYCL